jgi:AraC-like DNA-binding protein
VNAALVGPLHGEDGGSGPGGSGPGGSGNGALASAEGRRIDESVSSRPAAGLLPFIAHYSGYRQAGLAPARHRGLPSPFMTLIFTLDEPMAITVHPDPRQAPGAYETLIGGLHTAPALIVHDGRQSGIQVGLSPLGARALLGLPAGELADIDLDVGELLGPLAREIRERVHAESTWPARFAVLDRMLLSRISAGDSGHPIGGVPVAGQAVSAEVGFAWRRLLRSGGTVRIRDLVTATGWSDRQLRSRFRIETGLSPKTAARVIRFHRARRLLRRGVTGQAAPSLADLAAECGYYDQAHLAREFRELAGCPPTQWLAEEFRIVQARPGGGMAGSPS